LYAKPDILFLYCFLNYGFYKIATQENIVLYNKADPQKLITSMLLKSEESQDLFNILFRESLLGHHYEDRYISNF